MYSCTVNVYAVNSKPKIMNWCLNEFAWYIPFLFAFDIQTAVLTSELSLIWQDLKTPSVDTTLTQEEKVQLNCQTFSEVLHICEQLFLQFLHLMETLRRRGVFSDHINCSRVAAQLAIDCTSLWVWLFLPRLHWRKQVWSHSVVTYSMTLLIHSKLWLFLFTA